jgi:large subunit ribosomal protein L10
MPRGIDGSHGCDPVTAQRMVRCACKFGVVMALNLAQKKELVAELADVASKAHSLVAADYIGLSVAQLTQLRMKARQGGVYLKVAKNTLVRRAVDGTDYQCVADDLTGPLLYAFSKDDPGAAGRLIRSSPRATTS